MRVEFKLTRSPIQVTSLEAADYVTGLLQGCSRPPSHILRFRMRSRSQYVMQILDDKHRGRR